MLCEAITPVCHFPQNGQSPLGRVYELDGFVLLLGVGHENNTSLHLAEYKADYPGKMLIHDGFPIMEKGRRKWYETTDILYYPDDFSLIGQAFERSNDVEAGKVGQASAKLFKQKVLVDFAVTWMEKHRNLNQTAAST